MTRHNLQRTSGVCTYVRTCSRSMRIGHVFGPLCDYVGGAGVGLCDWASGNETRVFHTCRLISGTPST